MTAVKQAFVEACLALLESERAAATEDFAAGREKIRELSRKLVKAVRTVHAARTRSGDLARDPAEERAALEREFEQIVALPQVRSVEVEGLVVRVLTRPLQLTHGGRSFLIGELSLDLDLEGELRIRNLSNTIKQGGWEHPHVQGEIPCLGNLRDGVLKLLGELQLAPLTSLMIQFLESYEPETAYSPVENWQEVLA